MYNVLDLFSGIGGFSLGLERTGGFTTTAFCEICPKARKVLRKHWPDVPIYEDIKGLTNDRLAADGITIDVITGGFPCQDISCAGKGKGIKAERSGLWSEMFRLIRDVRPTWAIIENVPALRSKGLTLVLQNLCEIGYMCEWHCIPASSVGKNHSRDRIWIITYPDGNIYGGCEPYEGIDREPDGARARWITLRRMFATGNSPQRRDTKEHNGEIKSDICRVIDGLPRELDESRRNRIKQLGNSVVPQIPELIGNAILEAKV